MTDKENSGLCRLEEAIRQYEEEYYDSFPAAEEEISYSEKYLRSVDKLRKHSKNPFYQCFNTAAKRVAVIAAVFLLTISCSMTVSAVRKPIVRFFTELHEEIVKLFFDEDDIKSAPEEIEKMYLITELPEGSQWLTQFINDKDISTTWANDKVNVTLIQTTLDANFFASSDLNKFETKRMADHDVAIFRNFSVTIYIWNTEEYVYHLVIKGYMKDSECEKMIESLTLWDWNPSMKGSFINEN